MAERTLEERAAEAAGSASTPYYARSTKYCYGCPAEYGGSKKHADTCPSVVIPELLAEMKRLHGQIREMVEKAADQKLDGYRELGARAAAAENERDSLSARLKDYETVVGALKVALTEPGWHGLQAGTHGHTYDPNAIAAFKRLRG